MQTDQEQVGQAQVGKRAFFIQQGNNYFLAYSLTIVSCILVTFFPMISCTHWFLIMISYWHTFVTHNDFLSVHICYSFIIISYWHTFVTYPALSLTHYLFTRTDFLHSLSRIHCLFTRNRFLLAHTLPTIE